MSYVRVHMAEVARLATHPAVTKRLESDGDRMAQVAADLAPKLTGAGAASIHAEKQPDGTVRVGWDQEHDYMRFPEFGTEHQRPEPFLRPAANRFK